MPFRCPECGSTELRIEASVLYAVELDEDGKPRLGEGVSDPAFDGNSIALCFDCEYEGKWSEFVIKES